MAAKGGAVSSSQAVAETFEAELASIKEKGKDLKGDQRVFYQSIVERVQNNVDVLAELRQEHSQLRNKLTELVKEKGLRSERQSLDADLKHTNHEVNLLKKQIDKIKNEREKAINRQSELEVILANFKSAEETAHPEEQRIADMKNKLDRANIKNGETTHLMKIYQQIIHLMDKQKMHWTPIVQKKQAEIAQKQRDIGELELIARDSRHSLSVAHNEMKRTEAQISAAKKKRKEVLNAKKEQSIAIVNRQQLDAESNSRPTKTQQSLNSQPSVLRNKMNKAAREKREERFRNVSAVYEEVRDKFGTNDPEKIQQFFTERKEQTATLQKQIDDLKVACNTLRRKSEQLKSSIEEAEYASSKGVGGNRLLQEGQNILNQKRTELMQQDKEIAASAQHQKNVIAGVSHIADVLGLVKSEDEQLPLEIDGVVAWVKEKINSVRANLGEEDVEFLGMVNKPYFAQMVQRSELGYDGEESQKKTVKKSDYKRPAKDNKADITTRVLDRATIKLQAQKTVQLAQQEQKKKAAKQ